MFMFLDMIPLQKGTVHHRGLFIIPTAWGTHNIYKSPTGHGRHEVEVTAGVEDAKKLADKLIDTGKVKPYITGYKG